MESMTGFGEGRGAGASLALTITARSVNHRYLDTVVRMPENLRPWEMELLERVRKRIERGRIEIKVEARAVAASAQRGGIRHDVLRTYLEAVESARSAGMLTNGLSDGELLALPGVIDTSLEETEPDESDFDAFTSALEESLESLASARREEGARLRDAFREILNELERVVTELDQGREGWRELLAGRFRSRLSQLLEDTEIDPERMAIEVALLAEKSDVQEELDRLRAHLASFDELLEASIPVGRRMEFVCQEILRELNTVGSKCRESAAVELVLDGKTACEKLREQAQNIQ